MDIRTFDLNLLKAFDALMADRTVTGAAGRIGLSQPAMSHALARLRSLFEDELFVRSVGGMRPTARAREAAPLIAAAISQIEAALNLSAVFDPASSTLTFHAGIAEGAEVSLIGPLAEAFRRQAAKATLRLTSLTAAEAPEMLDRGTIDVAIARLANLPERFLSQPLMQDPYVVIARRGHPLAGRRMSVATYAAHNHVLVSPRGNTSAPVDQLLAGFGITRRFSVMIVTYLALPATLAKTDLIATVPRRTALQIAATADIEIMPLPIDLSVTVSMAWHRRASTELAQLWFRSLLVNAASQQAVPDRHPG